MFTAWERLPDLPAPISGQMAGVSNGAVMVFGGSSFPVPLFEGGTKTWVDTVYVLEPDARAWKTAHLPRPSAYGSSLTTDRGVVVIGGGDARENFRDVTRYVWSDGRLRGEALPPLPVPLANLAAAQLGSWIYVAGGQESPAATSASRRLLRLDLNALARGWQELDSVPAAGRILPVFTASGESLYLFSGAELLADEKGQPKRRYLDDGWRYRPGQGWTALAKPPRPMVAAPAVFAHGCIYVLGGDDGEFAFRIWELKDKHPGFHKDILRLDPRTGAWSEAGTLPFGLVTTTPVIRSGHVIIAGGEDRPGNRSAAVFAFPIEVLTQ